MFNVEAKNNTLISKLPNLGNYVDENLFGHKTKLLYNKEDGAFNE